MKHSYALLAILVAATSCNDEVTGLGPPSDPATETFAASLGVNIAAMSRTKDGVYFADLVMGTGVAGTERTDSVVVNYAAHLKDATQFDAGTNVTFFPTQLILGVRSGLLGMKEGGKRKLVIPSALGYGGRSVKETDGSIKIPRQSTLVFDVELLKVFNRPDSTAALVIP